MSVVEKPKKLSYAEWLKKQQTADQVALEYDPPIEMDAKSTMTSSRNLQWILNHVELDMGRILPVES